MGKTTELARLAIPLFAVIGGVVLGWKSPNIYGAAAMGVLSAAVSGFYGASLPSPAKTFEEMTKNSEEKP